METKVCKVCGKIFVPSHKSRKLCSEECRVLNKRMNAKLHREEEKRMRKVESRFCKVCGKEFKPKNKQMVMCSKKCSMDNVRLSYMKYDRVQREKMQKIEVRSNRKQKMNQLALQSIKATEEGTSYGKLELRSYLEQQSEEMAKRRKELQEEWNRKEQK